MSHLFSKVFTILAACLALVLTSLGQTNKIYIKWKEGSVEGEIAVTRGSISKMEMTGGKIKGARFQATAPGKTILSIEVSDAHNEVGPEPTLVSVKTKKHSFSFFLRDVNKDYPIFIPDYGVAVLPADDNRSYDDIEREILSRKTRTKIQQIETEKETSFADVAIQNKNMSVPVWLGISRDMRMFDLSEELEDMAQEGKIIRPKYASHFIKLADTDDNAAYIYALGRGVGVKNNITRRLEEGRLPIYHSELVDDDVVYHTTAFASFAQTALTAANNKGTNYIVADKHSHGRTFKEEHKKEAEEKMKTAYEFENDIVLYSRTVIENTGAVPRYAWIKTPRPGTGWWYKRKYSYQTATGFSAYKEDRVFCISLLNGKPLPNEETAILLKPGEKAEYDFFMPHSPLSNDKALALQKQSFSQKLDEAKTYWHHKLSAAANIKVPEKRIEEMVQAGLLHLDLITFGEEPKGTLSANIGVYSPIGTESAPIIQFYLSMGWHDMARRALNYFLETQLSSGYIQNYEGYTVETGAALWTMGEYIRYTRDIEWLNQSKTKILKSCDYLLQWRNKNKKTELKGRGYGLIDGKVADPEDHYHQFMLNGYAYLGLSRIAEVLQATDPVNATRIQKEADEWKQDIQQTVKTLLAISPVVPLGDGRWVPTLPPWAEADGLRALFQKKEIFWSHGTFTAADAMLGPLYLVFCEVIAPGSPEAKMLLDYHSELFYQGNAAFSQPYYSRHNWLQARLGMVKPFLSTYYNTFSAHADRATYTFWEHMFRVSQHKTHEEAWFLMETRWMLYMEEGDTLHLFKTIPRNWMEDGKTVSLQNVRSYFGAFDATLKSSVEQGLMEASVQSTGTSKPKKVSIRMPHPENKKPQRIEGGVYDEATETVIIDNFSGNATVRVLY